MTGSRDLKIWLADGTNYPGQGNMRSRQDWLAESLRKVYDRLGEDQGVWGGVALFAVAVVWLGSAESAAVTGCVFELEGGKIMLEDGWREGPVADKGAQWQPAEVGAVVDRLLAERVPPRKVWGTA